MSYQRCHCFAIFLRIMRIFDDQVANDDGELIVFLNLNHWQQWSDIQKEWETTNVANALQMPYERCKCFQMHYQRYQWLANAYGN